MADVPVRVRRLRGRERNWLEASRFCLPGAQRVRLCGGCSRGKVIGLFGARFQFAEKRGPVLHGPCVMRSSEQRSCR